MASIDWSGKVVVCACENTAIGRTTPLLIKAAVSKSHESMPMPTDSDLRDPIGAMNNHLRVNNHGGSSTS